MKDNDIKKAFESLTPNDEARERMFNAIINKNSTADATAIKKNTYKKPKVSPWYVRFKPQIGICSTAVICAAAVALIIMNSELRNIKQNNIYIECIDFLEDDDLKYKSTTTTQSENNEDSVLNADLKNDSADSESVKTTSLYKDSKNDNISDVSPVPAEYTAKTTSIISKPIETMASSSTLPTVKTTVTKETNNVTSNNENKIYMKNFIDFNCIIWNNQTYSTNYTQVEYNSISDSLGSSTALNDNGQTYSIVLYKIKNMPIEQGFAVQYAGRTDYYIFYNIE